jgi:flavorubredoxin
MKKGVVIYEQGTHRWVVIARDADRPNHLIDTNEYLVSDGHAVILLDPGGSEVFPAVFSALASIVDPRQVKTLFASHQDPDIISSLSLWMDINPDVRCYVSRLWESFVPHFGGTDKTLIPIPDEGVDIALGRVTLRAVPAHYLHSSGNFHLYDEAASILFSGDVGAAILPETESGLFVKDFDRHIRYAEGFHKRWMGSEVAKLDWCERASKLRIEMLCPQHGAIYQGADVQRFINWFAELEVGVGVKPKAG